jgi:hypothetical protein
VLERNLLHARVWSPVQWYMESEVHMFEEPSKWLLELSVVDHFGLLLCDDENLVTMSKKVLPLELSPTYGEESKPPEFLGRKAGTAQENVKFRRMVIGT